MTGIDGGERPSAPGGLRFALTTAAYDAADQLQTSVGPAGTTTYTFDAAGNQQIVEEPSGARTTSTWSYENQTTLVVKPSGARITSTYNADNRRVRKEQ
jgi:YD repeat-containing protein